MWKQYRGLIFLFFGTALLLYIAWVLRRALLLIYVSVLLAVLLAPIVGRIRRVRIGKWRPSQGAAVAILFLGMLGLLALAVIYFVPLVAQDLKGIQQVWPQRLNELQSWIHRYIPMLNLTSQQINSYMHDFVGQNLAPMKLTKMVIAIATVLLASAYFIIDGRQSIAWAVSLFPSDKQQRVENTLLRGGRHMQRWLSGQAILMLIHGCSALVVFGLLKIQFFYALALFAGIINIIPVLGPVITVIVAGLLAAVHSVSKLIGVVIFFVVYHNLENSLLNPRIMESKVKIPAVTIVVALVLGEAFAGIVGMLIAVPSAVLISVLINEYISSGKSEVLTIGEEQRSAA
jgi:predicted PurR-regulated permease PerM